METAARNAVAPVALKPRDLALLLALVEGRFVSVGQAARFVWCGRASANRRLAALEAGGYIRREIDFRLRGETIIRPTPRAMAALTERGLPPVRTGWSWRQLYERSPGFIKHELAVNEFRFRLMEACRETGGRVQVLSCVSGPGAADTFRIGETITTRRLRPDRFLSVRVPGTDWRQHFFLEIDRAMRPVRRTRGWDVTAQLSRYESYFKAGRFADRFALSDEREEAQQCPFRVLFITSTWERVDNIITGLRHDAGENSIGQRLRAYGVWHEFLGDPLGPVWMREVDGERCRLTDEWPLWPTF